MIVVDSFEKGVFLYEYNLVVYMYTYLAYYCWLESINMFPAFCLPSLVPNIQKNCSSIY